jgi:hypothetical protein
MARARNSVVLGLLGVGVATGIVTTPIVATAALFGPQRDMPGAEPRTEKAQLIEDAQREYERAARATLGPVVGRPEEQWHPEIVEGIFEGGDSPFEGSSTFTLSNMWQSRLSAEGRVTRVYAGADGPRELLIVTRHQLMSGNRELYREIELPRGVGRPRVSAASGAALTISTVSGRSFRLVLATLTLR